LTRAAGLQERSLASSCGVVDRTALKRLTYPSGLAKLEDVRDAILSDFESL
jgi:hypothetical protein